jgi:deazaflavin-dependent oxidoreductase (nitroreductase family)
MCCLLVAALAIVSGRFAEKRSGALGSLPIRGGGLVKGCCWPSSNAVQVTSGPGHRRDSGQWWGMALSTISAAVRGFAQRLGGTRVGVLAIGRVVSPLQRWLYRRTGGRVSLTGRAPVLLLTTTGRRTGKARTVPLLYLRDGDRVVICNVNPGFERPNPWILNLRAQPRARVQIGRDTIPVRARSVSGNELDRYWPRLVRLWPAYQTFYDRGQAIGFRARAG